MVSGHLGNLTIGTMNFFLALLRHVVLLALTVDRFGSVMYPFHYPRHSTKIMALIFAIGSLNCAVVSLGFDVHFAGCYNIDEDVHLCRCFTKCDSGNLCQLYVYFLVLEVVIFNLMVPLVLTTLIFCKAKKHRQQIACGRETGTFGNVQMIHVSSAGATRLTSEDSRAVVTLVLLFISIVVPSLPYIIYGGAEVTGREVSLPSAIVLLLIDLHLLVPTADAIIVWRNRDVKESAMRMCRKILNTYIQYASK